MMIPHIYDTLEHTPEIGRTLTDDFLFVHYENGVVAKQHRPSTRWEYFIVPPSELVDIQRQYKEPGNFIRF